MPSPQIRINSQTLALTRILGLLTVFFYTSAYAQDRRSISLSWDSLYLNDAQEKILRFEGARYETNRPGLPWYYLLLNNSGMGARLTETVAIALSEAENARVPQGVGTEFLTDAVAAGSKGSLIRVLPLRINPQTGLGEKLISFRLEPFIDPAARATTANRSASAFTNSSVLASGDWFRFAITSDGVYRITYDQMLQAGVDPQTISAGAIRLFGNGGAMLPLRNSDPRPDDLLENAIEVVDADGNGQFNNGDYFLFYGKGPDTWTWNSSARKYLHTKNLYSDSSYYYLTTTLNGAPKRVGTVTGPQPQPGDPLVSTFTDYAFYEQDQRNFIKSGREWFGEVFDVILSQRFNFTFPNLVPGPVYIRSSVAARTATNFGSSSSFRVDYNNSTILTHNIPNVGTFYTDDFARTSILDGSFNSTGQELSLEYNFIPYNSTSSGWLDYIALNVTRRISFSGEQLIFRDLDTNNAAGVRRYTISNARSGLRLWKVDDAWNVVNQSYQLNSGTAEFAAVLPAAGYAEYVYFSNTSVRSPAFSGKVENQNLHALANAPYIIISHPDFLAQARRLADFRKSNDNLDGIVVTTSQIYHEFSSGIPDPAALRDFIRMFYERSIQPSDSPRYVLLFGDASYDYKNRISNNTNYVPTFQSENSVSLLVSYCSDDFFSFLDPGEGTLAGSEFADVGVGRIPVRDADEARGMVDKVIRYSTAGVVTDETFCAGTNNTRLGDWRNVLCFVADDQDRNLHQRQNEKILTIVQQNQPVYNIEKIISDAYQQVSTPGGQRYPDVNDAINKRMERGALLVNYTGHGGELGWAAESILNNEMINSWDNLNNMPAFITATCEFSRHDDPQRTSAGEFVLLNQNGGGICLFTTVRVAFAIDNELINSDMIRHFFAPINGEMPRVGDIQRLSKVDNPGNRNLTLLGDPAQRLAYPKYKIATTSITESSTGATLDTLSALSRVTIRGRVTDNSGNTLTGFEGVVFPTIYDKTSKIFTLVNDRNGNDISLPDSFNVRKNILYKGKASVKNGEFSCSFIVPRDISFQYGSGRLSYYAHNGQEDANGFNENFQIGGVSGNTLSDSRGPEVKLFMNDENFVFGGITNSSPSVYAVLFDSSGINMVGNGIGHDITVILDGNPQKTYVLNDFYESDLDSYQKGRVVYPLEKLEEGSHTLTLKAWDINNNSAEAYTEFIVSSSAGLALERVLNYPNPFTTRTQFLFEHNKPCTGMAIQVQIYTVSGKLVKTIDSYQICEGFRNSSVEWDGKDEFGDPLARGVYIYRLKVRTAEGETAQKLERLVLLR